MAAVALAAVAACGSDSTVEPTAAPIPAAVPTATPTPEPAAPSTAQPEVNLKSLTMTAETTGNDTLESVSEAEGERLRTAIGDAAHEAFPGGELLTNYRAVGDLDRLYACLTPDNFVLFGVALTAALAGVSDESHSCLINLGREHPDAGVTFLGIETPPEAVAELARVGTLVPSVMS